MSNLVSLTQMEREKLSWRTASIRLTCGAFLISNWCTRAQPTAGNSIPRQPTIDSNIPRQPTVGNSIARQPTAGSNIPRQPTVGNSIPRQPTVGNCISGQPTVGSSISIGHLNMNLETSLEAVFFHGLCFRSCLRIPALRWTWKCKLKINSFFLQFILIMVFITAIAK